MDLCPQTRVGTFLSHSIIESHKYMDVPFKVKNEPLITSKPAEDATTSQSYSKDRIVQDICEIYKIETLAGKEFLRIAIENCVLMDKKQRDYGPGNISRHGAHGVIVRMWDKMERLSNLFTNRRRKATNESIRDSFRDISNYAIIAIMLDSGKWPNKE